MTFHLNCSVRIDDRLHYQLVVSNAKRVTGVKVELLNEKPESKEFGIRCSCDKAGRCYLSTGEIFAGLHIWLSMLHLRNALRDNQLEVVVGTYATTLSDVSATATAVVPSKLCDDILSVKRNIIVLGKTMFLNFGMNTNICFQQCVNLPRNHDPFDYQSPIALVRNFKAGVNHSQYIKPRKNAPS